MRAAITRLLGVVTVVGALLCAGILGYGWLAGPPAPIRPVQDGYRDRLGNVYTAAEYARFRLWERVLFTSFAATFGAGFAWAAIGPRRRRGQLAPHERATLETAVDRIGRVFPDAAAELRARGPLSETRPKKPESTDRDPSA